MEFRLLGPVEARDGARRIALSGSKAHTVPAALLPARGRVVSDGRLATLLPSTTGAAVLVTSRSRLAAVPGSRTVALDPLGPAASRALLGAVAGRARVDREREAVGVVADACAGLPLALRAAATRPAARPHWPAARGWPFRPRAWASCGPATSIRAVGWGRRCPSARPPSRRWRAPWPRLPGTFTAGDAAAEPTVSGETAEEFLERLVEESALEMSGIDTGGRPRYRFHKLMWLVAGGSAGAVPPDLTFTRAS
ncbi:hypothetical protein [Streptomyces sp. NPDC049590]|uniref:hypothetical protein n=1 Tax=Streptomyces sp. NPDC049590 TaxID=3154834 RepID=UPI00343D763C